MEAYIQVIGNKIKNMEKDNLYMLMVMFIKDNFRMIYLTVKEHIHIHIILNLKKYMLQFKVNLI